MGRKVIDISGKKFGELRVLTRAGVDGQGKPAWRCLCSCGADVTASGTSLRHDRVKRCKTCQTRLKGERNRARGAASTPPALSKPAPPALSKPAPPALSKPAPPALSKPTPSQAPPALPASPASGSKLKDLAHQPLTASAPQLPAPAYAPGPAALVFAAVLRALAAAVECGGVTITRG